MRAAVVLIAWVLSAASALAQPEWYPADDLVESLRPAERQRVVRQAGLGSANDLPLYELTLDVADDLRSFELDETAWFTNDTGRPLATVVFRIFANAVAEPGEAPLVDFVSGECLDDVSCAFQQVSPSAVVVRPEAPVADRGRLRVRMRLRGRMREIASERTAMLAQGMESLGTLTGSQHSHGDYGLLAHSDRVASMSYFFPVLARMRAGRWEARDASTMGDLGNDALAHVRARVRVADGVRVAASGVVRSARVGERMEHVASAGFVRDFALVLSPRLQQRARQVGDVTVRSHFVSDPAAGARVLDVAAHALGVFTRRFGPYPYTELDVAEAPLVGGAGGVEYSGLVTVATMFYRPAGAGDGLLAQLGVGGDLDAHRRASLELVTAHEVAHQWWHGLVGSDSRRHPYQDECLAQWSALLYLRERYGDERAQEAADRQVVASYHMMRAMGHADGAVDRPVAAFGDSLSYAGLVYGKGPFVYRALRQQIGDRAFFGALQDYVRDHRFRTAASRALFDRMARGRRAAAVRAIERRWLEETHGDADLGEADLGALLGGGASSEMNDMLRQLLGSGSGASPEMNDVLRQLLGSGSGASPDVLRRLLGSDDGSGSGASPDELLRGLIRNLQR